MNDPAGGVPYIIIGDQVFPGYAEQYDDGIKSAIVSLYKSSERYDVFEEYNKAVDAAKKLANGNAPTIIFWNFIFILGATITIILVNKKQHRELLESLQSNRKVVEVKEERFEKKEEVKKVKNAKKKK